MRTKRRPRTYQPKEPPRVLLTVALPVPVAQGILGIAELEEWSTSKVLASIVADFFKEAGREPLIKHLLATLSLNRAISKHAVTVHTEPALKDHADQHTTKPPRANKGRKLSPEHRAAIRRGIARAKRTKNREALERARQADSRD